MRTSRSKADNIKNFNSLCERDKELLSRYRDMIIENKYSRIETRNSVINTLVEYLACETEQSIYNWDANHCEEFLNSFGWSKDYQQLALKTLNEIFSFAKIELDLSEVILRKNSVDSTNYILTYKNLVQLISDREENYIIKQGSKVFFTKDVTTVTMIYLAWLGVPISEAIVLRKGDVNFATKTVRAGDKYYSFIGCSEIEKHFLQYISSDKYAYIKDSKFYERRYLDTDLFIKQTKPGTIYKETLAGKIKNFCGQTYEAFLISGRLNRLYNYEQSGGVISSDNYKTLSEITGISLNQRNTALENLLEKYQPYKEKRNHYTLKR